MLAECPDCHRKQAVKDRNCHDCGADLADAKKQKLVRYWVSYKLPDGKRERKPAGYSIEKLLQAFIRRRSSGESTGSSI